MAPADIYVGAGRARGRLFAAFARGDFSEGWWQGLSLSSLTFCVAIQSSVAALDRELAMHGGAARFIMDDGIAVGPPEVVFAAVARFAARVHEALGLVMRPSAYACWSPQYDLFSCPFRRAHGIQVGRPDGLEEGTGEFGIIVGGAPIGTDRFMTHHMHERASRRW